MLPLLLYSLALPKAHALGAALATPHEKASEGMAKITDWQEASDPPDSLLPWVGTREPALDCPLLAVVAALRMVSVRLKGQCSEQ